MSATVQQFVALTLVLLAATWLVRRWLRRREQHAGCDRCSARPATANASSTAVRPAALRVLR